MQEGCAQVHEAARAFDHAGDVYEQGRPGYPADVLDHLLETLEIDADSTVLDLAAGTGKLTRLLTATGARVVAVEPLEGMRRLIAERLPDVEALEGTAERIPLDDESVDAVAVAQAFHWFEGGAALAEIHRVLRPAGRLGLVWNVKDESVGWVARLAEIIEPFRGSAPRYLSGAWRRAFAATRLFGPLEHRPFSHVHGVDADTVVARVLSISFVAGLEEKERARVEERVRALLAQDPETQGRERLALPYRTDVFWCRRVGR